MRLFRIALQALRWRRGAAISILLVSIVAVAAAAAGPIYLAAARQSALRAAFGNASLPERDVVFQTTWDASKLPASGHSDATKYLLDQLPEEGWLGPALFSTSVPISIGAAGRPSGAGGIGDTFLASRDNVCAHLVITSGRCPTSANEVLVSLRSAELMKWQLGGTLVPQLATDSGRNSPIRLILSGTYQPPSDLADQYWWGRQDLFAYAPPVSTPTVTTSPSYEPSTPRLDTVFAPLATITALPVTATVGVRADVPLALAQVGPGDLPSILETLRSLQTRAPGGLKVSSAAPGLFERVQRESTTLAVPITVVLVDVLLLAVFVLYQVVAGAAQARSSEIAMVKLRGWSLPATLRFALLEPILLVSLAVPVGTFVAWQLVSRAAAGTFAPGTPTELVGGTWLAALGASVGGALACLLGVRAVVTAKLVDQFRRTETARGRVVGAVIGDAIALTLGAAGLVALAFDGVFRNGRHDAIATVAPGLVCLMLAVVGVRVLPIALRLALAATCYSPRVGIFLAVRQLVRRSAALRLVVVLAVAFGLTAFAVSGWLVQRQNRVVWASAHVGADRVLTVQPRPGVDLLKAVRAADPLGHQAMAVAEVGLKGSVGLLAVDSSRFAAVANWQPLFDAATLKSVIEGLRPAQAEPIELTGTQAQVTMSLDRKTDAPAWLAMQVQLPTHNQVNIDFAAQGIEVGRHSYTAALPPECVRGCRIAGFDVEWAGGVTINDLSPDTARNVSILGLGVRQVGDSSGYAAVDAHLGTPGAWRNDDDPADGGPLIAGRDRMSLVFDQVFSKAVHAGVVAADTPDLLPAVVSATELANSPQLAVTGPDGRDLGLKAISAAVALPQFLRAGAIVDYTEAVRHETGLAQDGTAVSISDQVWLSPDAPSDINRRLQAEGLTIVGQQSTSAVEAQLRRDGLTLAFNAMLYAAAGAALLATGAAVATVFLVGRRRAFELAAMQAVGVPRRALWRACLGEQWLLLGIGAGLGLLGGFLAARLSLASIPEFVDQQTGPVLAFGIPGLPSLVFGAAVLALVALIGYIAATTLLRGAVPARLRTAQE